MSGDLETDISALFRRIRRLRAIQSIGEIEDKTNIIVGEQVDLVVTYTVYQVLHAIFGMFKFGERHFTASPEQVVESG